jgi:hypothetical protein
MKRYFFLAFAALLSISFIPACAQSQTFLVCPPSGTSPIASGSVEDLKNIAFELVSYNVSEDIMSTGSQSSGDGAGKATFSQGSFDAKIAPKLDKFLLTIVAKPAFPVCSLVHLSGLTQMVEWRVDLRQVAVTRFQVMEHQTDRTKQKPSEPFVRLTFEYASFMFRYVGNSTAGSSPGAGSAPSEPQ